MPSKRALFWMVLVAAWVCTANAALADSGLGPRQLESTLARLRYQCAMQFTCPVSEADYGILQGAASGRLGDQFLLGLKLVSGDGVPQDRKAGVAWIASAAEAGHPFAADWIERKLQSGEDIEVDETRMAMALGKQAEAGDISSMRVLGTMTIRGRGVKQNPQAGIAMLLKAAEKSEGGEVEYQIAELYLVGTNGLAHDHDEAMKWYTRAAARGHVTSMSTLGGLWQNVPLNDLVAAMRSGSPDHVFKPDIVQSYCWRMRAALMGSTLAQYELALMLSRSNSDSRGNVIEADLVHADAWFRLAARDTRYNNSQVRAAIEPKLTTAELEQAKKLASDWRELDFNQLKATAINAPGREGRACPLME
jgi:TPR repeat protein